MHIPQIIERKRDGGILEQEEIHSLIQAFVAGEMPDYQMSALAMAIHFQGMTEAETFALTMAMMQSGYTFQWPEGTPLKVDKHSTGGVGDKVSLILAPLLASEGYWVPMVAGRGLGITGGTLDKLESIPGFNVHLDEKACMRQIAKIGAFIAGQTENFCPADKKLYALRDASGTVPSKALITASIMSKKLAESLDRLILDVKYGSGAFMKNRGDAIALAEGLSSVGRQMGVECSYLLTPMDEPLGATVGNALEVREAVEVLQGRGPSDLVDLTLRLCEGIANKPKEQIATRLKDGTAWEKFVAMVEAQGGDATRLEGIIEYHKAPCIAPFLAARSGRIQKIDAGQIGALSVRLGGGRKLVSDTIDHAVGFSAIRKVGEDIQAGEPLLLIHARTEAALEEARQNLTAAVQIG